MDTFDHPCQSRLSCPCRNLVLGHLQEDTHKASERFQRYFELEHCHYHFTILPDSPWGSSGTCDHSHHGCPG